MKKLLVLLALMTAISTLLTAEPLFIDGSKLFFPKCWMQDLGITKQYRNNQDIILE